MLLLKEDYITQSFGICRLQSLQIRFGAGNIGAVFALFD